MAMAVIIIGGFFFLRDRVDLRPNSEKLLRAIGNGKTAEVYAGSAPKFRQLVLEEKFVEIVDTMNASLGPFRRTIDIVHSEMNEGAAGTTARVILELEFAKAETTGDFSFHKVDGTWRLLGLRVSIPEDKREEVVALERAGERTKAPKEVRAKVRDIEKALVDGRIDDVYELTAPPFRQSVSLSEFRELVATRVRSLGAFRRILDISSSAQNKEKDRAQLGLVLEFERAKTTASFEFVKTQRGLWLISGFKIQVPLAIDSRPSQ